MSRNPNVTSDPGVTLIGHLRGRLGSIAATAAEGRERSRSPVRGQGAGLEGDEFPNVSALMEKTECVDERATRDGKPVGC